MLDRLYQPMAFNDGQEFIEREFNGAGILDREWDDRCGHGCLLLLYSYNVETVCFEKAV
jgi:hypothetical protein